MWWAEMKHIHFTAIIDSWDTYLRHNNNYSVCQVPLPVLPAEMKNRILKVD